MEGNIRGCLREREKCLRERGTFDVLTSVPPGQSCAWLTPPAPPGRGWTSWPGQTSMCAPHDTPSSVGERGHHFVRHTYRDIITEFGENSS